MSTKNLFFILLNLLLFHCVRSYAQPDWNTAGNTLGGGEILGSTGGNFGLTIQNGANQPISFYTGSTPAVRASVLHNGDFNVTGSGCGYELQGNKVVWYNSTTSSNIFVGVSAGATGSSGQNTFIGNSAGTSNGTGTGSVFVGYQAGYFNGPAYDQVAIGRQALYSLAYVCDPPNVAVGARSLYNTNPSSSLGGDGLANTAVGYWSLNGNTIGIHNTAIGSEVGIKNQTGSYNCIFGSQSGGSANGSNYSFSDNCIFGYRSGYNNRTGGTNCFLGNYSGYSNLSGANNIFIGFESGYNNTASDNIFCGYKSGRANTTGTKNVFIGFEACSLNTTAGENVAVGYQALATQSTGAAAWVSYNTAIGYKALTANAPSSSTSGNGIANTAVGHEALKANTTGAYNTAVGQGAFGANTTGAYNTAIGQAAAYSNTTGSYNTALGQQACGLNLVGNYNTCVGYYAGQANTASYNSFLGYGAGRTNTSGQFNTAIGYTSGYSNSMANYNTSLGYQSLYSATAGNNTAVGINSGFTITSGTGNTCLGYGADVAATGTSNATVIGNSPPTVASNAVHVGNTSVTLCHTQVGWGTYSDRSIKKNYQWNVPGIEFIKRLKPVSYNFDIHKENSLLGYPMKRDSLGNKTNVADTTYWEGKYDIEKIRFSGFIAQEVDSAAKEIGYDFSGVVHGEKLMSLRYSEFVVPLVKAVQELSHKQDSLIAVITEMKGGNNRGNNQGASAQPSGKAETITEVELANNAETILYQNEPNPFDGMTVIRYFIPENVSGAYVGFYDMYGKEIKKLEIKEKGFGKIEANTENLANGIYSYSIVVDGKVVDTKKMLKSK